jgi:hypothetical protein
MEKAKEEKTEEMLTPDMLSLLQEQNQLLKDIKKDTDKSREYIGCILFIIAASILIGAGLVFLGFT